jgi:DNA-binding SARP family transcriptional activator
MPQLAVRLLGGFTVELDGEVVYAFKTDKARALLAYLVVESAHPHRRETLAALLWPDRPDAAARANLRQALSYVRQALSTVSQPPGSQPRGQAPPFLLVTATDVQFNTASDYALDVAELEALAAAPQRQLLPEPFCADFLAGMSVSDSEAFQAWVLDRQEYYHRLSMEILNEQLEAFERSGDYEQAAAAARRQLRLEPWLEEAHVACMRALALAGRRDEALHQYEACCRSLQAELGVEPFESTQSLFADIRDGRLAAPAPRRGSAREVAGRGEVTSPLRTTAATTHTRARPTRLAGREDELGWLTGHLYGALGGATGVAFVSGDPGSGKTTLLEAFAASALAKHPDLLVAGARGAPGGSQDPFAPLRRLAEMLFGDLYRGVAWHPAGREETDRLGAATGQALACLEEYGPDLAGTLIPPASIARRAGSSTKGSRGPLAQRPTSQRPLSQGASSQGALSQGALSQGALSQGALFDQLLCTLDAIAAERPLVLLLDDLHWVDDATAAFLLHLGRELSGSRLLVLGAYRPEPVGLSRRDPATGETSRHPLASAINELRRLRGEIVLDLDRADGRAFVEAYVDTEPNRLGAGFRDALYAQTSGHALFTVELLRDLQERGELLRDEAGRWVARESLDWGALPARVEAAIAERIERLPENSRRFLSAASVQGDDFSGELVAELTGEPVGEVLAALSGSLSRQHSLVRAAGVVRSAGLERAPAGPGSAEPKVRSMYRFSHHLFQKYLYAGLDPVERARWHAAVAACLERQVGEDAAERERFAARLAWHYESAGLPVHAARALLDAGRQATRVSAFREALRLFDRGLALLRSMDATRPVASGPAEPEPARVEQLLQIARMVPQRALRGSAGAKFEDTPVQIAETLAGELDDRTRLAALAAEAGQVIALGRFAQILDIAQRMLDLATGCGDDAFEAMARLVFGLSYHSLGEPQKADGYFEWVLARHTPGRWAELRALVGFDLLSHSLTFSAVNKLALGYLDEALARCTRAVAAAQSLGDHAGLADASAVGSLALFLLRSDPGSLQERAELCARHCEKHGFAWWQHYAAVFLGWLIVMRGQPDRGIERVQSAFAAWQATGMLLGSDGLGIVLADACLEAVRCQRQGKDRFADSRHAGLLTEGLARVDALLSPENPAGQCYRVELYRMRGELLLARDGLAAADEALACFQTALEVGREKGALTWELRAAMSIVRLRARECTERASAGRQGDGRAAELAEARACLADVYRRFTEGFDFADLRDAMSLIGEAG